ncbi:MAG: hypothetical protein DSY47_02620 [Hydrogenothermus sp.]|nr:MAG: hypothetical protein DSY47_02620 [Hydrogenothermus sp.]
MENKVATVENQIATVDTSFEGLRSRLVSVLEDNKSACVKINGRLEITRPVALALLNELSRSIASIGGKVKITKDVLNFSPVVVKSSCTIELPNGAVLHFEALASAEETDVGERRIYHDMIATAETRSVKRLLEETVGEDFINKVLAPMAEEVRKISQKQLDYIIDLAKKKSVLISRISKDLLGKSIKNEKELANISSKEARKLIDYLNSLPDKSGRKSLRKSSSKEKSEEEVKEEV